MNPRHFTSLLDLSSEEFHFVIDRAIALKNHRDPDYQPLKGRLLAMIFEK
ncbi:MAG TPA: ornithine carbamoyltransferase, partial [Methylococcales bacterium]